MKVGKGFSKGNSLFLLGRLMAIFALAVLITLTCPQLRSNASAKTTITVNKIDQKTAKKVHKQLMKGKEFVLRFPGDEKSFYTKFQKLTKKVAKCTDYGFDVFPICMETSLYFGISGGDNPSQSSGYTIFTVKKKHCEEYIYGIKFAKREYKDFKAYIDQVLKDTEYLLNALNSGAAEVDEQNYKSTAAVIADAKSTIASLKEFKKYLQKTKFRNLSEAMRARIILEIGNDGKGWGQKSMSQKVATPSDSFKSLYKRKACGNSIAFASMTCKMCAAFQAGEASNFFVKYGMIARVKAKNRKGKTRYAIIDMGVFYYDYNFYAGSPSDSLTNDYRASYKSETIKKIKKSQEISPVRLIARQKAVHETNGAFWGDDLIVYKFDIPKSEW